MDENMIMEMEEESVFDKIFGMAVEINQMKAMIEENVRLIAEGDDVEGRKYLKAHLENEVMKKTALIEKRKKKNGIG